jgi:hypothetical protein
MEIRIPNILVFLKETSIYIRKWHIKRNVEVEEVKIGKEIGEEIGKEIGEEIGKEIGEEIGKEIGVEIGEEIGEAE